MIDEKQTKSESQLFILNNEEWQPIDNLEPKEYKYSDNEFINNSITEPIETTLEIEPLEINKSLMNKLGNNQEYNFILDNGIKLKGAMKQDYAWKKWVYRKKGKKYKKFLKHSKQAHIIFNGVIDND